MTENTNPVDPGTNDAGQLEAEKPASNETAGQENPGSETGQSPTSNDPGGDVIQNPANAIRAAHIQTARESHAGGQPLEAAADWLALQGHEGMHTRELAAAAILAI